MSTLESIWEQKGVKSSQNPYELYNDNYNGYVILSISI